MSKYNINSNPDLAKNLRVLLKNKELIMSKAPQSVLMQFKQAINENGHCIETLNEAEGLMPKYIEDILPIAIEYYQKAKLLREKKYLLKFFRYKKAERVIPLLLSEYDSGESLIRWDIGECLYEIRSPHYIDDYVRIISNREYGTARQMVVLLVGKLKIQVCIPLLIELLDDPTVRLHALDALGYYKLESLRYCFERFENDQNITMRKCARNALKKLLQGKQ